MSSDLVCPKCGCLAEAENSEEVYSVELWDGEAEAVKENFEVIQYTCAMNHNHVFFMETE